MRIHHSYDKKAEPYPRFAKKKSCLPENFVAHPDPHSHGDSRRDGGGRAGSVAAGGGLSLRGGACASYHPCSSRLSLNNLDCK